MSAEYPPEMRSQLYHRLNEMGKAYGVPTFIINERYKIVGAQPYSAFQETLQKIVAEKNR